MIRYVADEESATITDALAGHRCRELLDDRGLAEHRVDHSHSHVALVTVVAPHARDTGPHGAELA